MCTKPPSRQDENARESIKTVQIRRTEHDWDAVRRIVDAWAADREAVSWSPVNRIIATGWEAQAVEHTRLRTLLWQSRDILKPLDDPFLTDFALHRWLSGSRE